MASPNAEYVAAQILKQAKASENVNSYCVLNHSVSTKRLLELLPKGTAAKTVVEPKFNDPQGRPLTGTAYHLPNGNLYTVLWISPLP